MNEKHTKRNAVLVGSVIAGGALATVVYSLFFEKKACDDQAETLEAVETKE